MNSEEYKCYAFDVGADALKSAKNKYNAKVVGACIARPQEEENDTNPVGSAWYADQGSHTTRLLQINKQSGITLIALIITIIIMLILAGVVLSLTLGEHGIFKTVGQAGEEYKKSEIKEEIELAIMDIQGEEIIKGNDVTLETLSNKQLKDKLKDITTTLNIDKITGNYKNYEYEIDSKFKVTIKGTVTGIQINYTLSKTEYTNEDIYLAINATVADGEVTQIVAPTELTKNSDGTYLITKNGTYTFKVTDNKGNQKEENIIITNIDKVIPKKFTPIGQEVGLDYIKIKGNAQDEEETTENAKSGIAKYEYYVNNEKKGETENEEFTIEELSLGTSYTIYVVAYDKAENYKKSEIINIKTLTVPLPPETKVTFGKTNDNMNELDYAVITADGINYKIPEKGDKIVLEITSKKTEDIKYYYSIDGGTTYNEYIDVVNTEYNGIGLILVKSVYKDTIESKEKDPCEIEDALGYGAYDGNADSFACDVPYQTGSPIYTSGNGQRYKCIKVDKDAIGKKIKITYLIGQSGQIMKINFLTSNKNTILTTRTLTFTNNKASVILDIVEDTGWIEFDMSSGFASHQRIYEIVIQ